jgi:hypothetical protein
MHAVADYCPCFLRSVIGLAVQVFDLRHKECHRLMRRHNAHDLFDQIIGDRQVDEHHASPNLGRNVENQFEVKIKMC